MEVHVRNTKITFLYFYLHCKALNTKITYFRAWRRIISFQKVPFTSEHHFWFTDIIIIVHFKNNVLIVNYERYLKLFFLINKKIFNYTFIKV